MPSNKKKKKSSSGSGGGRGGGNLKKQERVVANLVNQLHIKPSPIHGVGTFVTGGTIKKGVYFIGENGSQALKNKMGISTMKVNSAMMPPWRKLLFGTNDPSLKSISTVLDVPRITKLKKDWQEYVNEEKAMASVTFDCSFEGGMLSPGARVLTSMSIDIKHDLQNEEEILRNYGDEWLPIKYYHLKSSHVQHQDEEGFIYYFDMNELHLQPLATPGQPESLLDVPEGVRAMLGRQKDLVAISKVEFSFFVECIGLLGRDKFQKGDRNFDHTWLWNMRKLGQ